MEKYIDFTVNGKVIRGVLHLPDDNGMQKPAIIICHGFTGNKTGMHRILVKAARYFCRNGYISLRFDFSGCGDSDGEHEEITIDGQVAEVLAAAGFVKDLPMVRQDRVILLGLSMGGAVAALAAPEIKDLSALVLWAPVANLYEDIKGIVGEDIFEHTRTTGTGEFMGFALGKRFLESLRSNLPLTAAGRFNGPLLLVHGTADKDVSPGNTRLFKEARQGLPCDTAIRLVTGADHTFSARQWEKEVFHETTGWLKTGSKCRSNGLD